MSAAPSIADHYTRGNLLERLRAVLLEEGIALERATIAQLAPYDHFHGRGLEATEEVASMMPAKPGDHLLDIGSGLGGPARYFADRFKCRVTGIDLTAEFCDVARAISRAIGQTERVAFQQGDALAMPFADSSFDGAYSMNVSMNIADKAALYREIRRVLKPDGWLILSELAQGPNGEGSYPTPWAATKEASFLSTPEQTRKGLEAAGFVIERVRDTLAEALAYGERSREAVERGEKPPQRAVGLIHGAIAKDMAANTARGMASGAYLPIELLSRKR